jgi:hypothetical protein
MAVTVSDKGNYVEIDRGEPSRRYVVKPFDVNVVGTTVIRMGDGLKNDWDFLASDLTGWTYTDIYDLKDQLVALNNKYQVDAVVTVDPAGLATEAKQDSQITLATALNGYVDGLEALLTTLNAKDFATETTLVLIKGFVDGIETLLSTISTNTTGLNLETTQLTIKAVLDLIKAKTDNLDVALSTRLSEADFDTKIGSLTETAPASDTASSGLNGRLQRIAQRISDLVGSKTETMPVTDTASSGLNGRLQRLAFRINQQTKGGEGEVYTITATISSTTLTTASSYTRKQVIVQNNSVKTMWISYKAPAVVGKGFSLAKGDQLIEDVFTGTMYGIWETGATGDAQVTEVVEVL